MQQGLGSAIGTPNFFFINNVRTKAATKISLYKTVQLLQQQMFVGCS